MANEAAIRKVISFIEEEPQSLDMDYWAITQDCQTTYCLAGWACVLNGDKIYWSEERPGRITTATNVLIEDKDFSYYHTIQDRAKEILGLTHDEGFKLFNFICVTCNGPHLCDYHDDSPPVKPTVEDLKRRITEVTGIEFK